FVDICGVLLEASDCQTITPGRQSSAAGRSRRGARETVKRDLTLADQTGWSVRCTLWGAEASNFSPAVAGGQTHPVVAIRSARVSDFAGRRSLNVSTGTSQLMVEPAWLPETEQLGIGGGGFRAGDSSDGGALHSLRDIVSGLGRSGVGGGGFSCIATVCCFRRESCVYKACLQPGCNKKVEQSDSGLYQCSKCQAANPSFKWRYILSVNVADHSCSKWATCFEDTAEKLLGVSADNFGQMLHGPAEAKAEAMSVFNALAGQALALRLRVRMQQFNDQLRQQLVVQDVRPLNFVSDCRAMIRQIEADLSRADSPTMEWLARQMASVASCGVSKVIQPVVHFSVCMATSTGAGAPASFSASRTVSSSEPSGQPQKYRTGPILPSEAWFLAADSGVMKRLNFSESYDFSARVPSGRVKSFVLRFTLSCGRGGARGRTWSEQGHPHDAAKHPLPVEVLQRLLGGAGVAHLNQGEALLGGEEFDAADVAVEHQHVEQAVAVHLGAEAAHHNDVLAGLRVPVGGGEAASCRWVGGSGSGGDPGHEAHGALGQQLLVGGATSGANSGAAQLAGPAHDAANGVAGAGAHEALQAGAQQADLVVRVTQQATAAAASGDHPGALVHPGAGAGGRADHGHRGHGVGVYVVPVLLQHRLPAERRVVLESVGPGVVAADGIAVGVHVGPVQERLGEGGVFEAFEFNDGPSQTVLRMGGSEDWDGKGWKLRATSGHCSHDRLLRIFCSHAEL
uniref:Rep_fac-A_C domain-containing protein n=1 Tax=Macrostomum lignano TaxID=282301 RepID=A0A1I8IX98_9PLAT